MTYDQVQILVVGCLLLFFGIFAIYSVSIFESFDLTLDFVEAGIRQEPSNYYFFFEQLLKMGVGLVIAWIVYLIPLHTIKKLKYVIFGVTLLGVLLLFTPLGIELKGSNARLSVPWGTIQPGEFFKIGFVMLLGSRLLRKRGQFDELQYYVGFLIITGLLYLLFLFIPDLGTVLVLLSVALIMFRYAGGKGYYVIVTLLLAGIASIIAASQFSYIGQRFDYFFSPEIDQAGRGVGWQTKQALIAVGGGGWIGKGYGKGLQKFGYIPEAQSDFIFAAFAEEIGFIGNLLLLILYFLLAYFFLQQLRGVRDEYDRLIGVGFLSLIFMQMFINIGVNIRLIPLTGLTLPLVSHGGSALIVNMVEIVMMYKILQQK